MIDANRDVLDVLLIEDVARLLSLPGTCFHLTVGSKVLRDTMSLATEGVGAGSVTRVCARVRGRMQPANGGLVAAGRAVTLGGGPAQTRSAGLICVGQRSRNASGMEL